jgi:hypothetical protein
MPTLSCITTCKSRLDQLEISLPRLLALADAEVIVVDYDCPQGTAAWVRAAHPAARVVKVEDRPDFNLAKARNLGAATASGEWLVFLDVDTLVAPDFGEAIAPLLREGAFLLSKPRPPMLWGALIVPRADFEAIAGYDEAFEGWGSEDEDIIERLTASGLRSETFPGDVLEGLPHSDARRTLHHEIKDHFVNNCINYLYRQAKRDLTRHGSGLTLTERTQIYAEVRRAVLSPAASSVQVGFRQSKLGDRAVLASLRYELAAPVPSPVAGEDVGEADG